MSNRILGHRMLSEDDCNDILKELEHFASDYETGEGVSLEEVNPELYDNIVELINCYVTLVNTLKRKNEVIN